MDFTTLLVDKDLQIQRLEAQVAYLEGLIAKSREGSAPAPTLTFSGPSFSVRGSESVAQSSSRARSGERGASPAQQPAANFSYIPIKRSSSSFLQLENAEALRNDFSGLQSQTTKQSTRYKPDHLSIDNSETAARNANSTRTRAPPPLVVRQFVSTSSPLSSPHSQRSDFPLGADMHPLHRQSISEFDAQVAGEKPLSPYLEGIIALIQQQGRDTTQLEELHGKVMQLELEKQNYLRRVNQYLSEQHYTEVGYINIQRKKATLREQAIDKELQLIRSHLHSFLRNVQLH